LPDSVTSWMDPLELAQKGEAEVCLGNVEWQMGLRGLDQQASISRRF